MVDNAESPDNGRPAIPAELKRRVLVEAGHRCAIPTCRHIEVDIHHIIPWATSKEHKYDDLIALCPNCHRRADREEIDRKSLRLYKANLRFAHDKFSQLELDVLFELKKTGFGGGLHWPMFNLLLINRILDAGFVTATQPQNAVFLNGMNSSPATLRLTHLGDEFLSGLASREY